MSEASFRTTLVKDSVIGDITPDLGFAVQSGGAQVTYQSFPSTSNSNSALVFNVHLPSESVVMDRSVLLQSGLTFRLNIDNVPVGETAFEYGFTDSLQAFPLNALFTTATAQINNTTVSVNLQDVFPSLLRMNDSRELYRHNSTTPSLPDQAWGEYQAGVASNANPLASYNNAGYDLDQVPRGSHPVVISVVHNIAGAGQDVSLVSTALADTWVITLQTVVAEPLFLSPFIWGSPEHNGQGMVGVNQVSLTFNIDATCSRLFSTAKYAVVNGVKTPYIKSIQLGSAINPLGFTANAVGLAQSSSAPTMLFKFLSTQASDLIQPKNVVPYMDMPRFVSSQGNGGAPLVLNASATLTSSNIQLNQIPDLFIINVRKPMAQQKWSDANAFLAVQGISINFNNNSGLLASASAYDLWRMSCRNGSTQSWAEFSGQQTVNGRNGAEPTTSLVGTTGSLIIINPAYDLSLPEYLSNGSMGSYNLQFNISVKNQFSETITPEIVTICCNSGIMVTQLGTSSTYTGVLTKEMVMSAKQSREAPMSSVEHARLVGGKMLNRLLTSHIARKRLGKAMDAPMAMKARSKLASMM